LTILLGSWLLSAQAVSQQPQTICHDVVANVVSSLRTLFGQLPKLQISQISNRSYRELLSWNKASCEIAVDRKRILQHAATVVTEHRHKIGVILRQPIEGPSASELILDGIRAGLQSSNPRLSTQVIVKQLAPNENIHKAI